MFFGRLRIRSLVALLPAFLLCLLAACGNSALDPIPPSRTADTTFGATPNPIVVTDGSTLGTTTLRWNTAKTQNAQIRVGSPQGNIFCTGPAQQTCQTGKWVTDGMQFFLQDSSAATPTSADATLDVITVRVIRKR